MIPLYKLDKLPRTQKLRKIAKIFTMAERRLHEREERSEKNEKIDVCKHTPSCQSENRQFCEDSDLTGTFTTAELVFFTDAAKLLAGDLLFQPEACKLFTEAAAVFEAVASSIVKVNELRRALNSVKHLLLAETGKDQADWDFTVNSFTNALTSALDANKRRVFCGMWVYLEDIRSPFNVGAMFRTAESFGVEKMILSPFCADPRHRRAKRTAMGCIEIIPWERQNLFAPEEAQTLPCPVFALETGGIPINEFPFPQRGLLIAGSEELGVSPRALEAADASLGRVSIPIYGAKASLNVSTAFGIALQAWSQAVQY